jgi:hypothetical protein
MTSFPTDLTKAEYSIMKADSGQSMGVFQNLCIVFAKSFVLPFLIAER